MDRSDNESLSRHACPTTEPSSKRSEDVRNVIIAVRGLAKRLSPIFHLDISKYIPRRGATPKMLPAEVHTWRVGPLFFPEEDFAAEAIRAIVSSAKRHDREQQLSVNHSNIKAGVTATGTGTTTTIGNSSSMAQEEAAASATSATNAPSRESEPFGTGSPQTLSDEEWEDRWELQEKENKLRLQQLHAQRDDIKAVAAEKKAKVEADYKPQQEEEAGPPSMWEVSRNLTELEEQLREETNRLWRRIAMEKEWEKEDGEDDESESAEDGEEKLWDPEAAKRRIHRLETRKMGQEYLALYHRVQIQSREAEISRSEREQKKMEALLEVEEEYNREMQAWAMRMDEYDRDMYAWYKRRDEYEKRKIGEEQRHQAF